MRLLFFSNVFPNPFSQTRGTFNLSLVTELAHHHQVRVVSPISWVDELRGWMRDRIRIDRGDTHFQMGIRTAYPRYYYTPKVLRPWYGHFQSLSCWNTLRKLGHEFDPEAVLSYWTHPDGEVAVRFARRRKIPAVIMVGGSDVLLLGRRGLRRKAILRVLQRADAIITVSEHLADCLQEDGIPGQKIHTIYRGIDTELFCPGDRQSAREKLNLPLADPVLVSVGRLVPVKAHHVLIDACSRLVHAGIHIRCYIVGSGPLESVLRDQVRRLELQEHVHLVGSKPQYQLPDWYRAADLTVMPSLSEGIPNVLLESIACGTPFVASHVGGIPEIADLEHDSLVLPGNPEKLAQVLEYRLRARSRFAREFLPRSLGASARSLMQVISEQCEKLTQTGKLVRSP